MPMTRRCSACEGTYPLTADHFYRDPSGGLGFGYWCKGCHNADRAKHARDVVQQRKSIASRRAALRRLSEDHADTFAVVLEDERRADPRPEGHHDSKAMNAWRARTMNRARRRLAGILPEPYRLLLKEEEDRIGVTVRRYSDPDTPPVPSGRQTA